MTRPWASLLTMLFLTACGTGEFDDLRAFMDEAGRQGAPKLEPLPSVKPPPTFEYDQGDLQDPFKARSLRPEAGKDGFIPDLSKRTGPFVDYPLDALRMVGLMRKGKQVNAVIRLPDNRLLLAKVGDAIGQNFGIIAAINDAGMDIKETILDSSGNWSETITSMAIQDSSAPTGGNQ